ACGAPGGGCVAAGAENLQSSVRAAAVMQFRALRPVGLTLGQLARWTELQQTVDGFESPYFRPEFTLDVAAVRNDVEVVVFEQSGEPVGFLPFQRGRWNVGYPVGWPLSDFQGAIVSPQVDWDPLEVVRACGLSAWDFDHVLVGQRQFRPHHVSLADSPYMDLTDGFDTYAAGRRRAGSEQLTQALRKGRKARRELGAVRFEAHTEDPAALERLIEWKRDQYRR